MSIWKRITRSVSRVARSIGKSPLASTALSLFPPTSAIGLSLKAYQGFRSSRQAPEEYLQPQPPPGISPFQFFPEIIGGARAGGFAGPWGALAGGVAGGAGSLLLGGPDDDDDYGEDDYDDDDYDEEEEY